jgi:hypothetical protein
VVNGRRPGAENADHGKYSKTERLLAEYRATLYDGFIVEINGRDWTINIMKFGETSLALLAGNEP